MSALQVVLAQLGLAALLSCRAVGPTRWNLVMSPSRLQMVVPSVLAVMSLFNLGTPTAGQAVRCRSRAAALPVAQAGV
jgi:hypothetical protein